MSSAAKPGTLRHTELYALDRVMDKLGEVNCEQDVTVLGAVVKLDTGRVVSVSYDERDGYEVSLEPVKL